MSQAQEVQVPSPLRQVLAIPVPSPLEAAATLELPVILAAAEDQGLQVRTEVHPPLVAEVEASLEVLVNQGPLELVRKPLPEQKALASRVPELRPRPATIRGASA